MRKLIAFLVIAVYSIPAAAKLDISRPPYNAVRGTDATTGIQAAIDDAEALPNGETIFIPCGLWPISYLTIEESNVSIEGEGSCSVLFIENWGVGSGAHILAGSTTKNLENIHFRNFKILGTHPRSDRDWYVGLGPYPKNAIQIGLALTSVSNSGYFEMTFEKAGGAQMTFSGGQADPALEPHNWDLYAVDNESFDSVWTAVNAISGGSINALIKGNRIHDIAGLGVQWSGPGIITGNTIERTENSAVATAGRADRDRYIIVSGNLMNECGKNPETNVRAPTLMIGDGTINNFVRATGNTIRNAYGQGIALTGQVSDIQLDGNLIDGFGIDGVGATLALPGGSWSGLNALNGKRIDVTNTLVIARDGQNNRQDYGILTGGSGGEDTWTDGNRTRGTFLVKPFIQNSSSGADGTGTRNRVGRNIDLTAGRIVGAFNNANQERAVLPAYTAEF